MEYFRLFVYFTNIFCYPGLKLLSFNTSDRQTISPFMKVKSTVETAFTGSYGRGTSSWEFKTDCRPASALSFRPRPSGGWQVMSRSWCCLIREATACPRRFRR
jgi:hypothetical protein